MSVINVNQGTFGNVIRNGDMIGIANVVEHLRLNNPEIKFYLNRNNIEQKDYCLKFYDFLCENTDYFSTEPGQDTLSWNKVNVWDFRDISGDRVKIQNTKDKEDKIVIFPVMDAPYNVYRNWPKELLQILLRESSDLYEKKILCVKEPIEGLDLHGFEISTDFITNIKHIMNCNTYIGGDTGTSHFASALVNAPDLIYWYSSRGLIHTLPFYLTQGKGVLKTYWGNFEGTTW